MAENDLFSDKDVPSLDQAIRSIEIGFQRIVKPLLDPAHSEYNACRHYENVRGSLPRTVIHELSRGEKCPYSPRQPSRTNSSRLYR